MESFLKDAVEFVFGRGVREGQDMVKTQVVDGRTYTTQDLRLVDEPKTKLANPIQVHTLSGVVECIESMGSIETHQLLETAAWRPLCVVCDHSKVKVFGPIMGHDRVREVLVQADCLTTFDWSKNYKRQDELIIEIQAKFVQDDQTHSLLHFLSALQAETSSKTSDDGVSQVVTMKRGAWAVGEVKVPNPVTLRPFRTFPEIEQPECQFVLRVDTDGNLPVVALVPTENTLWKTVSVLRIKEWLKENRGNAELTIVG